jgi:predicted GNAT family N-acyltransferase
MEEKESAAVELCLNKIKDAQSNWDTEGAHIDADNALCDFLVSLGYENIIEEYKKVIKWYA